VHGKQAKMGKSVEVKIIFRWTVEKKCTERWGILGEFV
jgi:hypothetical protein